MTDHIASTPADRPARPPAPDVAKIPVDLRLLRQWVLWRYEFRDDKWTKIPYQPAKPRVKAKADDPSTWGPFDLAWEAYQAGGFDGIGFEFSADDEFYGVDVDKCLSESGEPLDWAAEILAKLTTTYGEISPSGRGIKFIARGKLPERTGTRRNGFGTDKTGALELYDHGRFFTLTGERFGDGFFPNDLQGPADDLYRLAKERPKPAPEVNDHADPFVMTVTSDNLDDRITKYLATCEPAISGNRGHDVTLRVACAIGPGFGLTEDETYRYLCQWNATCQPPWSEKDLRRKVSEAFKVETRRGWIRDAGGNTTTKRGSAQPAADTPVNEAADDPHRLARIHLAKFVSGELPTLRCYRGEWLGWSSGAYRPIGEAELQAGLTGTIKGEFDRLNQLAVELWENERGKTQNAR